MKKIFYVMSLLLFAPSLFSYPFESYVKSFANTQKEVLGHRTDLGDRMIIAGQDPMGGGYMERREKIGGIYTYPTLLALIGAVYLGWKGAEYIETVKAKSVSPLVKEFAQETLSQAGYSTATIAKVKIIETKRLPRSAIILNGITDEFLMQAKQLQKEGSGYIILDNAEYSSLQQKNPNMSQQDILLLMAQRRLAITPDTIALLKWDLLQQMADVSKYNWNILSSLGLMATLAYAGTYQQAKSPKGFLQNALGFSPYLALNSFELLRIHKIAKQTNFDIVKRCYENNGDVILAQIKLLNACTQRDKNATGAVKFILNTIYKLIGTPEQRAKELSTQYERLLPAR